MAGAPIIGIGLDSAEAGNPAGRTSRRVYAPAPRGPGLQPGGARRAKRAGLALRSSEALDLLHIERVDHGIQLRSMTRP